MSLWTVGRVEFRRRELDFTSSGQGKHMTTAVIADGTEIINALDLVDATEDPIQTIVCEQCGYPGCAGGNRVSLRRFDGGILFMPAFDAMAEGGSDLSEHGPPYFVSKRGSAFFRGAALAALAARIPFFADPQRWPPLTMRESVLLLQWDAPSRILGAFPDKPSLREESLSAASHGTEREAYDALGAAIEASSGDSRRASLVSGEPVFFYLDQGFPDWTPLTFDGDEYRLALAAGIGVEPLVP
jgi:hypothetical protein